MSDRKFTYKRDYIPEGSTDYAWLRTPLFLNELIANPDETIEEKDDWTIGDIDRRTEFLIDKVIETFLIYIKYRHS